MIGIVGLGLLGGAIARRLLAVGHVLVGHDVDPARLAEFAKLGGNAADSAAEVADRCRAADSRRIVFSLPTTEVVRTVLEEMEPRLARGTIIIDTTTGEPRATAELGARLAEGDIDYLDATVSGSSAEAAAGQAVVMAGGGAEAFAACQDIFAAFARRSFHVGPWGAGARMKLVSNLVLGLNRAALAEGLSLARAMRLDLATALDVLREGAAYSRAMDAKGRKMIEGDFSPQARLAQHLKDVRLMLAAAEEAGATVPLSTLHRELLEGLVAQGHGEDDNSAIIRAFG
jgi:3-hydroxyisobutyrate dehydrogenase-like beta-hydroxyacid dehydrogenase